MRSKKAKNTSSDLRCRAEKYLQSQTTESVVAPSREDSLRYLHELQVHQIELEMQNTELRQARQELETVLEKYTDLYEYAPDAYVSLDHNGCISSQVPGF